MFYDVVQLFLAALSYTIFTMDGLEKPTGPGAGMYTLYRMVAPSTANGNPTVVPEGTFNPGIDAQIIVGDLKIQIGGVWYVKIFNVEICGSNGTRDRLQGISRQVWYDNGVTLKNLGMVQCMRLADLLQFHNLSSNNGGHCLVPGCPGNAHGNFCVHPVPTAVNNFASFLAGPASRHEWAVAHAPHAVVPDL